MVLWGIAWSREPEVWMAKTQRCVLTGCRPLQQSCLFMGKLPCDGSATCRGLLCSGMRGQAPSSTEAALAWGAGIMCLESLLKC